MYKFEEDRIIALRQLKKNSLSTFNDLVYKIKIPKITKQIETLRMEYKSATDKKEKERIAYEGRKLKDEIEMYKSI